MYGDLYLFNASTSAWLSIAAGGAAPAARSEHGVAMCGGLLYVFGGIAAIAGASESRHTPRCRV